MDKRINLKRILHYIEANLYCEINAEDLSRAGYLSLMQLYRDFYACTGHSVKEYIRKRRLSNALALVESSDMSLADIAYACGYSSQQAFCRSVRAAAGKSPLEYKSSGEYYYFPPFRGEMKFHVGVATQTVPETVACKYVHSQLRGIENRAVNGILSARPAYRGRLFGRNGRQTGSRFCYELFMEDEEGLVECLKNNGYQDIEKSPVRTAVFAALTVENTDESINRAWDYLYVDWLQSSMFEQDDGQYFEEYLLKNGRAARLRIYLPIRKKNAYCDIKVKNRQSMTFLVSRMTGANAEEAASRTAVTFLASHYPYILKNASEFLVQKTGDGYVCGVRVEDGLSVPTDAGVELMVFPSGTYAVLSGCRCGDAGILEKRLLCWVEDHGFHAFGTSVFTVYEAVGGYEAENINAAVYYRLENVKN